MICLLYVCVTLKSDIQCWSNIRSGLGRAWLFGVAIVTATLLSMYDVRRHNHESHKGAESCKSQYIHQSRNSDI